MRSSRMKLLFAVQSAVLMFSTVLVAQNDHKDQAPDISRVKTADFAWMTGRWIGRLQTATAEQICSTPESGEMLCLFRVFVKGQPVMFETYTLFDTPQGLELRSLHFSTDLVDKTLQQPLVMKLQKFSDREIVFAGVPGCEVDTSTLFRDTPTTMNGLIMFRNQKEPHIRVHWEKVAYDAKVNYNSVAAKP
jgi:Domain of unknown function (DUF6265)